MSDATDGGKCRLIKGRDGGVGQDQKPKAGDEAIAAQSVAP